MSSSVGGHNGVALVLSVGGQLGVALELSVGGHLGVVAEVVLFHDNNISILITNLRTF